MNENYVVGRIWNEQKKRYQSVIGYEFLDTPGLYQFFEIGSSDHFRKRPTSDHGDSISSVTQEIYKQFYSWNWIVYN